MSDTRFTDEQLRRKAQWVWGETMRLHRTAPETRLASALSCVEILTVLAYGGVMRLFPRNPLSPRRDRLIISKGHGTICLFPILADLGFIDRRHLGRICSPGALLGSIPDPTVAGYETINGSLGHGLGVACGSALALARRSSSARVAVLHGDGELNEGSVWEAVMLAAHHHLSNLTLIIDANGRSMLGDCRDIIDLEPLPAKFRTFGWDVVTCDGHDVKALRRTLRVAFSPGGRCPRAVIARTRKGHGVPALERDPLCHIRMLGPDLVDRLLEERGD